MTKGRLEAFSDGVIAIIITLMALELKIPHEAGLSALILLWPVFLCYLLSFIFLGIYWNNHHHLLHAVHYVDGRVLWANQHLLFWLSLIPFVTGWMGENHFSRLPVAVYGFVQLASGCAYFILTKVLISKQGKDSVIARAMGKDFKGKISLGIYAAAIPLAFLCPWLSCSLYVIVAIIWLVPDQRIEKLMPQVNA